MAALIVAGAIALAGVSACGVVGAIAHDQMVARLRQARSAP